MHPDELKGKATALKGKIEQKVGDLTGDTQMQKQGVVDEVAGQAQDDLGHVKRKVREAIEGVAKAVTK